MKNITLQVLVRKFMLIGIADIKEDILHPTVHVDADLGDTSEDIKINQEDYHFNYDSFPVIGLNSEKIGDALTLYDVNRDMDREEIAFLGLQISSKAFYQMSFCQEDWLIHKLSLSFYCMDNSP